MSSRLVALRIAALDPQRLARFWTGLLGWGPATLDTRGVARLVPPDDTGFELRFAPTAVPKREKNQMHFDLTSQTQAEQDERVGRALDLGARHIDVGQKPDERHVVLADPEGDEFCIIEPGNRFLAECGLIGALSSDGTRAEGLFWAAALGWPLVWDHDEETAVRSPRGGPKITWGGPPLDQRSEPNRWLLELDVGAGSDGAGSEEIARLVALGAVDFGADRPGGARVLTSPDGNPFTVSVAGD